MTKVKLFILMICCFPLWGGNVSADDDFNPPNPEEPAAVDYCRLTVSASPSEGADVSGGGKYLLTDGSIYVSTNARNTPDYEYIFKYWTENGVKTSYSQSFYYTPKKGKYELVAHYQKKEVVFDPDDPQEPSQSNIKKKYYLTLTCSIEGACSFSMASGNKIEEGAYVDVSAYVNNGYKFEYWKLNGNKITTDIWAYFNMPSAHSTLEAVVSEIPFDPENPIEPSSDGINVDNSTRKIIEFSIGNSAGYVDKTRIVLNEKRSLDYESDCDASKFISNNADFQIYSLGNNVKYSINERPLDNGEIPLGIVVKKAGSVTIGTTRLECSATLIDKVLNKEQDMALGEYTFESDAGTIEDRFYIKIGITEALTITAKSYTRTYGNSNPSFQYTALGAVLKGVPSIACEATKTSPVGTYPIVISKGSVSNFNVTYVDGMLTIEKAPLTITAKDYTIKQGQSLPEFEATYDGFKNGETKDVLTKKPTFTTTATSASEPGEYDITVSGAEAQNYDISYAKGKLTIVDADALIITAKSYTIKYGDEIPAFEYTSDGAALEGTPSIACEATKTSPVGTYPIVISKGSVKNYNVTYVNGTLTIEKAPLTITAKDYTIKQGEALPTFEATYDGFKNNETEAVLTKQPTITTTATSASEPGEYEISVSGTEAKNYDISYVNGKLTIVDADALIITAKSYTIKYGDDLPAFEYTSEGAAVEGTPSITCEATITSPVGTYPIVISKGSVSSYNVTYVNGTLTIEKAPLKITAKDYTIKQGEALPTFEATYDGFKNDETEAVLTKQPTITTTATSASEPDEYDITISGAEAENYEISYINGKLTITEADGILGISVEHSADVYDLQGNKVRSKMTTLKDLPKGVYIINGRKVLVK